MKLLAISYFAMFAVIALSNYLVMFPINDWLTWAAFPYPISFFITELTNRSYGPQKARQVVYVGFITAAFLSIWLATPKIALASGSAFLISQMLDISVFNRWRQSTWWKAPLFASVSASMIDTAIFWIIAFWGEPVPLLTWALGDFLVKLGVDLLLLTPFRFAARKAPALSLKS